MTTLILFSLAIGHLRSFQFALHRAKIQPFLDREIVLTKGEPGLLQGEQKPDMAEPGGWDVRFPVLASRAYFREMRPAALGASFFALRGAVLPKGLQLFPKGRISSASSPNSTSSAFCPDRIPSKTICATVVTMSAAVSFNNAFQSSR